MKIKPTFVTNSSSASFTILKSNLTDLQIQLIYEHIEIAYLVLPSGKNDHDNISVHYINNTQYGNRTADAWQIEETKDEIKGWTSMDNFDIHWYLTKVLNIPEEHIDYDHSNDW
jgi:hypothetical protein